MAKVTVSTNEGTVVAILTDDKLPSKLTPYSSSDLALTVWSMICEARQEDEQPLLGETDHD